jgi:hypothetical protein
VSTTYKVPLSGVPETFGITLAGVAYQLTVQWRDAVEGGWFLDIADKNSNPILRGIPLITGADLLGQYGYLGLGGSLFVQTSPVADVVPTFETLGTDSNLYFVTP